MIARTGPGRGPVVIVSGESLCSLVRRRQVGERPLEIIDPFHGGVPRGAAGRVTLGSASGGCQVALDGAPVNQKLTHRFMVRDDASGRLGPFGSRESIHSYPMP